MAKDKQTGGGGAPAKQTASATRTSSSQKNSGSNKQTAKDTGGRGKSKNKS